MKTIQSPILQAALSGLLLSAAFPKVGFSWLAWIALVPLLLVLRRQRSGSAFRIGMIAGLAHYLTLLYWVVFTMRTYGFLPWWQCVGLLLLLSAYLAIYPGLFALALTRFGKSPVAMVLLAPIFWVGLEYARSFLLTGFPWGVVGYSQVNRLLIIQLADMFGVYGVSFLVVSANAVLSALIMAYTRRPWQGHQVTRAWAWQSATFFIVLICLSLVYGNKRIGEMDRALAGTPSNRIAVIQGNIDQARKWDPAFQISTTKKYLKLTRKAIVQQPDLVVWPETATPFYFGASPKLSRLVTDVVRKTDTHLLLGSPRVQRAPDRQGYYNSAYLLSPDGRAAEWYDKVHLVPFGEYVPFKRLLSFVGKMVAQVGDFSAGEKGRTLAWGQGFPAIGVQICFEIIFPELSRSLVKNGAGVLINLTNDAWFGKSSAAYQHFSMTVFRAVENRRSLIRCANTGISGFVDPVGRIISRTELFQDAVVTHSVPQMKETTFYTQIGDFFPLACLITLIILVSRPMVQGRIGVVEAFLLKKIDRFKQVVRRKTEKRR